MMNINYKKILYENGIDAAERTWRMNGEQNEHDLKGLEMRTYEVVIHLSLARRPWH